MVLFVNIPTDKTRLSATLERHRVKAMDKLLLIQGCHVHRKTMKKSDFPRFPLK